MPKFRFLVLGTPALEADGEVTALPAERLTQLLALLALRADWVPRETLSDWLWPELPVASARRNLRKLLYRAKHWQGLPAIEADRSALRWRVTTDLSCFDAADRAGDWATALALVRGPLLDAVEFGAAAPLAEWIVVQRSLAAAAQRQAFEQRRRQLAGDPAARAALARKGLANDPLDDDALVALHQALRDQGQQGEAERVRIEFVQRQYDTLGAAPSPRVAALAGLVTPPAGAAAQAPVADADLVGRRTELQTLQALFTRPECRLVSIVGPGGVGKSRLARAACLRGVTRRDPVLWVALEDLANVEQLAPRLALALGLELRGRTDPWAQIGEMLRDCTRLLVLDNAEHLAGLAERLRRLLDDCPALALLITSRLRLGLGEEWLLPLEGLPVPDADETETALLRSFDAVRLFEQRAAAAAPGADLAGQWAEIAALVRDVDGLPLAIELAAAQVRLWPPARIRRALALSIDALERGEGGEGGRPGRRNSVRASFLHSWEPLTPPEQRALAALAVFPGSFDAAAAEAVAAATPARLARWVDHSLLRADGKGRFSLHALLRQLALEQLGSERAAASARHAAHYARTAAGAASPSGAQMQSIETEFENLHAAWMWAVAQREANLLNSMCRAMGRFFEARGRWTEGSAWFDAAINGLGSTKRAALPVRGALAALHAAAAVLAYRAGALDRTLELARVAMAQGRRSGEHGSVGDAQNLLGLVSWQRGRHRRARRCFEAALAQAEAAGDVPAIARAVAGIALAEKAIGNFERAAEFYERSLALRRELGDVFGIATTLNNLGNLHRAEQHWDRARALFDEAVRWCGEHRLVSHRLFPLINLGLVALAQGDLGLAERCFDEAAPQLAESSEPYLAGAAQLARARIASLRGQLRQTGVHLQAALLAGLALSDLPLQLNAVTCWGEHLARSGQVERGAALLAFAARHRQAEAITRREARTLAEGLPLSAAQRRSARAAARSFVLQSLVLQLLAEAQAEQR